MPEPQTRLRSILDSSHLVVARSVCDTTLASPVAMTDLHSRSLEGMHPPPEASPRQHRGSPFVSLSRTFLNSN